MDAGETVERARDGDSVALSTGHRVDLPLECELSFAGAAFPASYDRLAARLPTRLTPIRVGPRTGAVVLLGIEYHRVAGFEPYTEFAVVVPTALDAPVNLPALQLLGADVGGYVHALPVTTEASVALGTELWGYPKELADVSVADVRGRRRTTLTRDGHLVAQLDVDPAPTRDRRWTLDSYAAADGRPVRAPVDVAGPVAVRPPGGASLSLGGAHHADDLRVLGLRTRPLARIYGSHVEARVHTGERPAP